MSFKRGIIRSQVEIFNLKIEFFFDNETVRAILT